MICGACNQDRHPVIEGDQNGRFQYTCGNGECHAFIKLHERSLPSTASPASDERAQPVSSQAPAMARHAAASADTVGSAVAAIVARLAEVDAALAAVPELKAEQKKLRRMLAASQAKPVTVRPVIVRASNGQVGYSPAPKAHQ